MHCDVPPTRVRGGFNYKCMSGARATGKKPTGGTARTATRTGALATSHDATTTRYTHAIQLTVSKTGRRDVGTKTKNNYLLEKQFWILDPFCLLRPISAGDMRGVTVFLAAFLSYRPFWISRTHPLHPHKRIHPHLQGHYSSSSSTPPHDYPLAYTLLLLLP